MSCTFVCLLLSLFRWKGPRERETEALPAHVAPGAQALMGAPSGQHGGGFSDGNSGKQCNHLSRNLF